MRLAALRINEKRLRISEHLRRSPRKCLSIELLVSDRRLRHARVFGASALFLPCQPEMLTIMAKQPVLRMFPRAFAITRLRARPSRIFRGSRTFSSETGIDRSGGIPRARTLVLANFKTANDGRRTMHDSRGERVGALTIDTSEEGNARSVIRPAAFTCARRLKFGAKARAAHAYASSCPLDGPAGASGALENRKPNRS